MTSWWMWILLGLGLLVLELATPGGLFALFFGLSAIVVGLLEAAGVAPAGWAQWVLFSVLSIAALVLLRRPLQARLSPPRGGRPVDSLVGETAVALDEIPVGEIAKAELRGTTWNAHNAGSTPIPKGHRCKVERVDGLQLWVRPE